LIRCYITDRTAFGGDLGHLLGCIERNSCAGIEMIQIREKDLGARDLLDLTRSALRLAGSAAVLVNDRVDVAIAAGARGVHLRSDPIPPTEWRRIVPPAFRIGVSCHSLGDIARAEGADYVFFSPVFDSPGKGPAAGLDALRQACRATSTPVIALGGITARNMQACLDAGAAGIAAIRMFQQP
jgi:thiamine-phosphate pyrophosphorylase